MGKKVAIILINWNSHPYTADCIRSLEEVEYRDFDVIMVDNGSQDGSGALLKKEFPHIILIQSSSNLGFTGGNNLGIRYSIAHGYTYTMLLNNDTFAEKKFLQVLVAYMDAHADVGVIQPKICFNHNRALLWNAGSYYNAWLGLTFTKGYNKQDAADNRVRDVDWVTGCAFFTRNNILQECGPLAENLFIYYEDVDLSFRIKAAGHRLVYHPGAVIYHIAGMSSRKAVPDKEGYMNPIVHHLNVRNRIWLLKKYTPLIKAPTVFVFTAGYLAALLGYFAARGRFIKFKTALKGIRDGLKGNIG
jgi:GT2 family glycosyltransferase